MKRYYCMIIGDIINSKEITPSDRYKIQEQLKNELEKINFDYDSEVCSRFMVTLGDELQGGLLNSYHLFDILGRIKKSIQPYKIRFGIGINYITTHLNYYNSFGSDGPAYHLARKGIEELKLKETFEYGYRFYSDNGDSTLINSLFNLIDDISSSLTKTQKRYVDIVSSSNCDLSKVAENLNISLSTLSRTLSRANYKLTRETIENIRTYLYDHYAISNKQDEFIVSYNKACRYYSNNNYWEAIEEISSKKANSEIDILNQSMLLSLCYTAIGENQKAIEIATYILNDLDAEYIHKKIKLFNIIGINYTDLKQLKKAENSFMHAIDLAKNVPDTFSLELYTKANIARLYTAKQEYVSAEKIYLDLLNTININFDANQITKIQLMSNLGLIYIKKGEHYRAYKFLTDALSIAEVNLSKNSRSLAILKLHVAEAIVNLSNIKENIKLQNKFKQLIDEFLDVFKRLNHQQGISDCYVVLTQWNEIIGDNFRLQECKELLSTNEEK